MVDVARSSDRCCKVQCSDTTQTNFRLIDNLIKAMWTVLSIKLNMRLYVVSVESLLHSVARWLSEESLLHFVGAVAQCGVLATLYGRGGSVWSPCYNLWALWLSVESLLQFVGAVAQCGVLATICGGCGSVWSTCYTLWARWLSVESLLHFVGRWLSVEFLLHFVGLWLSVEFLLHFMGAVA